MEILWRESAWTISNWFALANNPIKRKMRNEFIGKSINQFKKEI